MSLEALKEKIPGYAKDIKLNLSTLLSGTESIQLNPVQISGCALAAAYATQNKVVIQDLENHARQRGLTEEIVTAIKGAASIMAMNNVYYRSVDLIEDQSYKSLPTQLRMHILQNHGITQQDFELYCLVVSVINGCGRCIDSHANVLIKGGLGKAEIHYGLRIAAVVKAVAQVIVIEGSIKE